MRFQPEEFDRDDSGHVASLAQLWNAACGPDLAITNGGARYNTRPCRGARQAGRIVRIAGTPAGIVLATEFRGGDPSVSPRDACWIDAIAVAPEHQGQGIGAALLAWAENWLAARGCTRARLGGSLRPFAPGLPSELARADFFRRRGYVADPDDAVTWDVARDLRAYEAPAFVAKPHSAWVRPARSDDATALDTFFAREFGGRWRYEQLEFLSEGGRISDIMVLVTDAGIDGFCWLTFEDSLRTLDRVFMNSLPRPWGHLGPIGVSAARRGTGFGAAVLDAGLCRLRDAGVAGCVIDWTSLVGFYGKFGFTPFRRYEMMGKTLQAVD